LKPTMFEKFHSHNLVLNSSMPVISCQYSISAPLIDTQDCTIVH